MDGIVYGDLKNSKTSKNSDRFEINTGKSQGNESVLVAQIREKLSSLESEQKSAEHISEESITESEILLIQHKIYITQKNTTPKIQHQKYNMENITQKSTRGKYNTKISHAENTTRKI